MSEDYENYSVIEEEFEREYEEAGFNIPIKQLIDLAYERDVLKNKNCTPHDKFCKKASGFINDIEPYVVSIAKSSFYRACSAVIKSEEFIYHASRLLQFHFEEKMQEMIIFAKKNNYLDQSGKVLPALVFVGLAAAVETKTEKEVYSRILDGKTFEFKDREFLEKFFNF